MDAVEAVALGIRFFTILWLGRRMCGVLKKRAHERSQTRYIDIVMRSQNSIYPAVPVQHLRKLRG